jgi:hypothetical protein
MRCEAPAPIPAQRGAIAAYCPEANGLVPLDYQDEESGTPSYKSVPVRTLFQGRESSHSTPTRTYDLT